MKYEHQPVEIQWRSLNEEIPPDNDDLLLSDGYGTILTGYRHNDNWYDMHTTNLEDLNIKFWAYKPPCPGRLWGIITSTAAADALLRTIKDG